MLAFAARIRDWDVDGAMELPRRVDLKMKQCRTPETTKSVEPPSIMEQYVASLIHMLTQMGYKDNNYSSEERRYNLHHVYSKTIAHFTRISPGLAMDLKRMQAFIQTIVRMVVYGYPKLPLDVMSDLCIYYTYTVILDDCKEHSAYTMHTFVEDLISGSEQKHSWWQTVNGHLPNLLKHYGPLCSFNIFRSTLDFFQGCWIEQHEFQGFENSHDYPEFLRRLNGLGHCVGASLFPKQDFEESKHIPEIVTVIAEIEQWEIHVNDLLSFYKESFDDTDQANLVSNYAHCTGCSISESLSRLTESIITSNKALKMALMDKDVRVKEVVEGFMQGYVTWHLTDLRYRIHELVEKANDMRLDGWESILGFWKAAMEVGDVEPKLWAFPTLQEMVEEVERRETQLTLKSG